MLKLFKAGFWLVVWLDVFIIHLDYFFSESHSNSNHQCYHFAILKMYYDFFVIVCVALTCSRKLNIIMTWTIIIFIIKLTRQRKRKCCDKLQRSVRRGEEGILGLRGSALRTYTGTGRSASSMLSSGGLLLFIVSKQMVYSLIYIMRRCLMWRTKQPSIYTRWVQSSMLYRCYWIRGTDEDVDRLRIVKLNFFLKKCWSV